MISWPLWSADCYCLLRCQVTCMSGSVISRYMQLCWRYYRSLCTWKVYTLQMPLQPQTLYLASYNH